MKALLFLWQRTAPIQIEHCPPLQTVIAPPYRVSIKIRVICQSGKQIVRPAFCFGKTKRGIRTRREQTCLRKKTVLWTAFADVVKEQSGTKAYGTFFIPSVVKDDTVSLRLGHTPALNVHRTFINYRRAASLPCFKGRLG